MGSYRQLEFGVGARFGRLVVVSSVPEHRRGHWHWLCRCDCGVERWFSGSYLKRGRVLSCGCVGLEKVRARVLEVRRKYGW